MFLPYSIEHIKRIFKSKVSDGRLKKDWVTTGCVHSEDYFALTKKLREIKNQLSIEENEDRKEILKIEFETIKELQNGIKDEICNSLYDAINETSFGIQYDKVNFEHDVTKFMYTVKDRNSYFAAAIISDELQRIYKLSFPNRNLIVKDVISFLSEPIDKIVVRTDIRSFFESISQAKMIAKLTEDGLASPKTVRLLNKLFYQMRSSGCEGVPRGISFSSYLSEIYLRDVDTAIKEIKGVFYYRRYVDDIIVFCSPNNDVPDIYTLFKKISQVMTDNNLSLHEKDEENSKTFLMALSYGSLGSMEFSYLGYKMILNLQTSEVKCLLSDKHINQYEDIIDKSIKYYIRNASCRFDKDRRHQALYVLNTVLRYMCRNYRLIGGKKEIFSGIYFKHRFINDLSQLKMLDVYLYNAIDKNIVKGNIQGALYKQLDIPDDDFCKYIRQSLKRRYSFVGGFKNRKMCSMSAVDFRRINAIKYYEEKY